ncbi:MAG: exodeoxyribonuclease VII large subunit [Burkholderiaceae bacterium]|nr:exodeoxyribonuclease VII large subunit [Burkholderiaceae bacterium]
MNSTSQPTFVTNGATVISVSALNLAVAQLLERQFPLTWISGEISNFTRAASGHWYFTLKDSAAQVRAVMFRGRAQYADFAPREGDKVEVRALVGLYAPRGDYQINVEAIRRAGVGNLYEAFLQLKAKLGNEGLFDPARKRPLPYFVRRIGIVTSPNAAALRDVLISLQRRAPHVSVILYPTVVQGEQAAASIAQAIATASARQECDVLLVCRGGGSIEDLWSFNAEIVARTIAHCDIPVICGVGHETDFTIADFAADVRAPTPTAAAELATATTASWQAALHEKLARLQRCMHNQLAQHMQALDWANQRLVSPLAAIKAKQSALQHAQQQLRFAQQNQIRVAQAKLNKNQYQLFALAPKVALTSHKLVSYEQRLKTGLLHQIQQRKVSLMAQASQLEMLNPQRTLERGYSLLIDQQGQLIRSSQAIKANSVVTLRTASDTADLTIRSVQNKLAHDV